MLYLRLHWNTKTTQRFRCNSLGLSYHCSLFHIQRDVMSLWVLYSPIDGFKLRWDYHLRFIMDNIIYRYNARRDFQFRTWWASQKLAHTVCPKVSSRTPCPSGVGSMSRGGVRLWAPVLGFSMQSTGFSRLGVQPWIQDPYMGPPRRIQWYVTNINIFWGKLWKKMKINNSDNKKNLK